MAETKSNGWMGIVLSLAGGMVLGGIGAALLIRFVPGVWNWMTGANKAQA